MTRAASALLGMVLVAACAREGEAVHAQPAPAAPAPPVAPAAPAATPPGAPGATPSGAPAPAAQVPMVRERREIMSTIYEISVVTADDAGARAAINQALDEVARLERVLSEWIPESDVSRINAAAGQAPVQVSADTLANVRASLDAARRTHGAFDITWAALRRFYLFQPGERKVPDVEGVRAQKHLVNYRDVVLDEKAGTVFLKRRGMAIGLGGIAKGWAVDRASAILIAAGFPNHMVFAGGQVLVHGLRGDRKWRIGIQHPRRDDYIGFIEATDASIATAGDYEHSFIDEQGKRWHHIIDPETALPATRSTSVTLIAPTGLLADALDTGCFVMGPKACLDMLAELPERVEAVILDPELRVLASPSLKGRLIFRMPLDAEGRLPP